MKKLMSTIALILLLATTVLVPTGCAPESEETEITPSESNRWLELLRVLPDNENTLKAAYLQDYAYLLKKMEQYSQIPAEYAIGHALPLIGARYYDEEEWKQTLGFVAADVEQTVYAGTPPIHYYEAVRGRFNRDDVDNAARTGPGKEMLEVVTYQGHEFYSWGVDFDINLAMRSNVRPLGRGHRLACIGDFAFWILWTDGVKEMIDSYEDNIDSLADNEDYWLLAGGLEELDTVTAFFSAESHSLSHFNEVFSQEKIELLSPEIRERFVTERDRDIRLKPYQALATGAGKDGEGYYLAIALANPDDATARDNAKLLEQRINEARMVWGPQAGQKWADLIESAIFESNGRLTLAKFYGPVVEFWDFFEILGGEAYEPLLLHE
jgi:hypothetical protein